MSAKSVVSAVTGFLTHHVGDLTNLTHVLGSIANALPIDSQDKERINSVVETLNQSAENIAAYLNGNTIKDGGTVTVKESDIETAIAGFLASDTGKEYVKSLLSTEGNGA